jgi:hypothetical protein
MNNFYEDLKKYFETTPQEKILEDWAKTKKWDNVGPTVNEFLINTENIHIKQQIKNLIDSYQIKLDAVNKKLCFCYSEGLDDFQFCYENIISELNNILENNK